MEQVLRNGETYSERKLTELLEYATDDLEPGPGYSLRLEGVAPTRVALHELEARFGIEIDAEQGASIQFSYSEEGDHLVLESLFLSAKSVDGEAGFSYTSRGYVDVLRIKGTDLAQDRQKAPDDETMLYYLSQFGIKDMPHCSDPQFKAWQAHLLGQTRAWHLVEQVEVPFAISDQSMQTTTLAHEVVVDEATSDIQSLRSMKNKIILFHGAEGEDHSESVLELSTDAAKRTLRHYLTSFSIKNDPFVINSESVIESNRPQALPITAENFDELANDLREVIHQRQLMKQD